jgi:hypothetical protein
VSELRLSFRIRPSGLLSGLSGPRTVHLDIVDYPGEWLLDLALIDRGYAEWSAETLRRAEGRAHAAPFRAALEGVDPAAPHDEGTAQRLAAAWTATLAAARAAGLSDCTPGRFLLPGDLAGSPALTFAPLPAPPALPAPRGSLWREMARRYRGYAREVVQPFFRDHFARIDRQVVLVDVLGAIHAGPAALEDLRRAMADLMGVFRPGRSAWLSRLLGGGRIERPRPTICTTASIPALPRSPRRWWPRRGRGPTLPGPAPRPWPSPPCAPRPRRRWTTPATAWTWCAARCSTPGGPRRSIPASCPKAPPCCCRPRARGRRAGWTGTMR